VVHEWTAPAVANASRRAARRGRGRPLPRHAPPPWSDPAAIAALRPGGVRRGARLRRRAARPLPGALRRPPRLDLPRGGRRGALPPAGAAAHAGRGVDRQLGRRRADATSCGATGWTRRARCPSCAGWRTASATRRRRSWSCTTAGVEFRGWAPSLAVPRGVRRQPRHPARPAARVRGGAPGHSHHPRLRGAGLRHPARLAPLARRGGALPPGRLRRGRHPREMAAALRRLATDEDARRGRRRGGWRRSWRATPATTARTSCWRSSRNSARRAPPAAHPSRRRMHLTFFGSSLVSSYWNGAATYYRGLLRALHGLGHRDHLLRARRLRPPAAPRPGRRPAVRPGGRLPLGGGARRAGGARLRESDWVIKCSGVGVWDAELEAAVAARAGGEVRTAFLDVDAPATLGAHRRRPGGSLPRAGPALRPRPHLRRRAAGGGRRTSGWGARACTPVYNALDPDEHRPLERRGAPGVRPPLHGEPAPGPRGARGRVLLPRRRALPGGALRAGRRGVGGPGRCRRTSTTWATSPPRATTR
jgi:hypothetical protein